MIPILETINLSIGYGGNPETAIASGISLAVNRGKLIALVGANGIGKSTLLRTLSGLQKPVSGAVLLGGINISTLRPTEIAKQISLVLTEKLPPGNSSVFEIVASGRQPYTNWIGKLSDEDRKIISRAMEVTQTSEYSNRHHYELSDGQLQKVMIARALAQDTPVVILDEPTTHLDLAHKVTLFDLLEQLSKSGKTVLFSTHDIELAIERSDEMILMAPGRIDIGTPTELMEKDLFNSLFKNDNIAFDREKVKFVLKGREI